MWFSEQMRQPKYHCTRFIAQSMISVDQNSINSVSAVKTLCTAFETYITNHTSVICWHSWAVAACYIGRCYSCLFQISSGLLLRTDGFSASTSVSVCHLKISMCVWSAKSTGFYWLLTVFRNETQTCTKATSFRNNAINHIKLFLRLCQLIDWIWHNLKNDNDLCQRVRMELLMSLQFPNLSTFEFKQTLFWQSFDENFYQKHVLQTYIFT